MSNNNLKNNAMRKIWIIAAVLFGIVSCTDTSDIDNGEKGTSDSDKRTLTLVSADEISPRISIGDKEGADYLMYWVENDALGLYSTATEVNIKNERVGLTKGAGSNKGVFVASGLELPDADTDLLIYHSYNQYGLEQDEKTGIALNLNIDQVQSTPDNSDHIGKYGFSYDLITVPAGAERAEFSLNHPLAYVKFVISTTEFASYKLQSVQLYDPSHEAKLSGKYNFNPSTEALTVSQDNTNDNVRVSIENPQVMSESQEVYLTTFAANLTGKDVYVVVTFVDDKGATVTIPKKIVGKELKAGTLNIITVNNISESDNEVPWFETRESRLLAGGWAYGETNTVMIVGADTRLGNTVTISVKARGNFAEAREPKQAYVHMGGDNADGVVLVNGYRTAWTKAEFASKDDLPKGITEISPDYKITLHGRNGSYAGKSSANGSIGTVVIIGDDQDPFGNPMPLWSFNVWVSKDEVKTHTYPSGRVVLDRNIGAPVKDAKTWWTNGAYFQWGRTTFVPWGAGRFESQPTTVKHIRDAIRLPNTMLYTDGVANAIHDWYLGGQTGSRTDSKDDLWGNPNPNNGDNPNEGTKSIYDPCPKGFMVASPQLLKEVEKDWTIVETYKTDGKLDYVYFSRTIGGEDVIWPFAGCRWGTGPTNRASSNTNYGALYWSNSPSTNITGSSNYVTNMQYIYATNTWAYTDRRTGAQPVRCMKDNDNR